MVWIALQCIAVEIAKNIFSNILRISLKQFEFLCIKNDR